MISREYRQYRITKTSRVNRLILIVMMLLKNKNPVMMSKMYRKQYRISRKVWMSIMNMS